MNINAIVLDSASAVENTYVLNTIVVSVLTSLIASVIFWVLTYVVTGTKVVFSECIEKQKNEEGRYKYRIRIMNCGSRDLFEVSFFARVIITRGKNNWTTYLQLGEDTPRPILSGRGRKGKKKKGYSTYIPELEINDVALREFKKRYTLRQFVKKRKIESLR